MSPAIRIILVDDHPIVRAGLVAVLSTQDDFAVVAEASGGEDAVRKVTALRPDVVLLDLEMPELDGVDALRHMRARSPDTRVVIFTAFDTDERIVSALKAGAQGYLLKGAPRETLFEAIRVVHAGSSLLQPIVASKLLRHVRQSRSATDPTALTGREREVLPMLARGLQNKEIGAALGITERTVKFHMSSLFRKLGAGNRTEAVAAGAAKRLIDR